jgi:hypothetical protein
MLRCNNTELMKMRTRWIIIFLAINLLGAKPQPDWNKRMYELRSILSELLPDLISDEQFNSPKNFERIEKNAKKLADLTHGMPGDKLPVDADPSITFIAGLFKDEILLAYNHLINGHRQYARAVLKSVPRYCIACHTRFSSSLDLSSLQQKIPKILETSLEKAEFFDATWQFDKALDEFQKILDDPLMASDHQLEWQGAAYYAIATTVRVKRDPDRALAVVNRVINSTAAPLFLKQDARHWQESLQQWKNESPHNLATADALLKEAERLIALATDVQEYPSDRSTDILYLRASACLHDFLSRYPTSPNLGKALLLLGTCYEILQSPELWSLHELYYESCIRESPHTDIAQTAVCNSYKDQ